MSYQRGREDVSLARHLIGMAMASIFTLAYCLGPLWLLCSLFMIVRYPFELNTWLFCAPVIISFLYNPPQTPHLLERMTPVLDYFDYDEAMEFSNEEFSKLSKSGKSIIFAAVPHGVFSYGAVCRAVAGPFEFRRLKTAVAPAVAFMPFVKNVVGMFGAVDASAKGLRKHFKNGGIDGSVVLYVGGVAELFKCNLDEERIYLSKRKGFIKLALREGVDVVPIYFFGNTTVLSILKHPILEYLSRKIQAAVTLMWGKYGLPIPRSHKIFCAIGSPLGLPYLKDPTDEEINIWHAKYCKEIKRIFDKYKEKVPLYKDKELFID